MFSNPTDKAGLALSNGSVAPKGSQPNGKTFGDLLAQLAGQKSTSNSGAGQNPAQGNAEPQPASNSTNATGTVTTNAITPTASTGNAGSSVTVSETTIAINESIKVDNLKQLTQAEQALVSLATSLAQIIQLISNLQQQNPQQAQAALSALSNPQLNPSDLQSILNTIQPLVQKLPGDQNPLQLTADQQASLLSQMFQQMLQAQQILLGVAAPTNQNSSGVSNPNTGIAAGQNVSLQLLFNNTNINETVQNNAQTSQVFINLETFKMSATFIQLGNNGANQPNVVQGAGVQFQPLTQVNSQSLINSLNQALSNPTLNGGLSPGVVTSPTQSNSANLTSLQSDLSQNFKDLVQLLMQSGVTQAALTTLMTNQQKGTENSNSSTFISSAITSIASSGLAQTTLSPAEIQPITQAVESLGTTGNTLVGQQKLPGESNILVNEMLFQAGINVGQQPPTNTGTAPVISATNTGSLAATLPVKAAASIPQATNSTQPIFTSATNGTAPVPTTTNPAPLTTTPTATGTAPITSKTNASQTNPIIANAAGVEHLPVVQTQESALVSTKQNPPPPPQPTLTTPIQPVLTGTGPAIDTKEIAILNGIVSQLNAAALHAIQGSVTIGSASPTADNTITLKQILSAAPANNLTTIQQQSAGQVVGVNSEKVAIATQAEISPAASFIPIATTQNQAAGLAQTVPATTATPAPAQPPAQPIPPLSANTRINTQQTIGIGNAPSSLSNVFPNPTSAVTPVVLAPSDAVPPVPVKTASSQASTANNSSLPQPATLPTTPSTPLVTPNPIPAPSPATNPATVAQMILPPPTSTASNLPTTAVAGEALKTDIPIQTNAVNINAANQLSTADIHTAANLLVAPEAVSQVANVSKANEALKVGLIAFGNNPSNSAVLQANQLLNSAALAQAASNILASAPPNVADGAQIIGQISQQVAAQTTQGKALSHLSFQLMPESLGRITVQVVLVDQSVSARIMVTNSVVREALQNHMIDLKTALSQAGLQIDQLHVQVGGGSSNLLSQYFQYQQEGYGSRLPDYGQTALEEAKTLENTGLLGAAPGKMTLLDVLA